ncbi:hypothetical protein ACFSJ3_10505 [Corallincola platygyrae]|uniref:Uncharacterized protein n=1 Tax=Corallincola platygyrae TaxID=1193278 RepID=A0ABW4XNP2_9GAMM
MTKVNKAVKVGGKWGFSAVVGGVLLLGSSLASANEEVLNDAEVDQSLQSQVIEQTEETVKQLQVELAESLARSLVALLPTEISQLRGE